MFTSTASKLEFIVEKDSKAIIYRACIIPKLKRDVPGNGSWMFGWVL